MLANQLLILRLLVSVAPYLTHGTVPTYAANVKKRAARGSDDEDDDESEDDTETAAYLAALPDASAERALRPPARQGSVLITLRNASPYTLWNVPLLAKRLRTVLAPIAASAPALPKNMRAPSVADAERNGAQYTLWRSFEFFPQDWPGYSHRRTVGWVEGLSTSQNEDLLRRPSAPAAPGKPTGSGECRTWELGLQASGALYT